MSEVSAFAVRSVCNKVAVVGLSFWVIFLRLSLVLLSLLKQHRPCLSGAVSRLVSRRPSDTILAKSSHHCQINHLLMIGGLVVLVVASILESSMRRIVNSWFFVIIIL